MRPAPGANPIDSLDAAITPVSEHVNSLMARPHHERNLAVTAVTAIFGASDLGDMIHTGM